MSSCLFKCFTFLKTSYSILMLCYMMFLGSIDLKSHFPNLIWLKNMKTNDNRVNLKWEGEKSKIADRLNVLLYQLSEWTTNNCHIPELEAL